MTCQSRNENYKILPEYYNIENSFDYCEVINESEVNNNEDAFVINELNKIECVKIEENNKTVFLNEVEKIAEEIKDINNREHEYVVKRLSVFEKLFTSKLGVADTVPYQLKIKPHKKFIRKSYPVPMIYRERNRTAIQEMEEAKIIEKSDSDYCSPLRIVVKSDGTIRVCLDARYINEIIESDHEVPPFISEVMQKFHGVTFMSMTDLASV